PDVNNLVVTFIVCDKTHVVVGSNTFYLLIGVIDHGLFLLRDNNISQTERKTSSEGESITHSFDLVKEFSSFWNAGHLEDVSNNIPQGFFGQYLIDETCFLWNRLVKQYSTYSSVDDLVYQMSGLIEIFCPDLDHGVKIHFLLVVSDHYFFVRVESQSFSFDRSFRSRLSGLGHVIKTKHHILRRYSNRRSICRVQNVVGSKHQKLSFQNSFRPRRKVNRHLVSIEIRVEVGTYQ